MIFTFTGRNATGSTACGGYVFPTGTPVEVEDADTIRRLTGHPEFKVEAPKAEAVEETITFKPIKRRAKRTKAN